MPSHQAILCCLSPLQPGSLWTRTSRASSAPRAADLDGESSFGGSRALRVKVCVGLPQAGRFQDVATLPVDEEAPRIEIHLVARRLEVQGHCGHNRVRTVLCPQTGPVGRGLSSSLQRAQGPTVWVVQPHPHHGFGVRHSSQGIKSPLSPEIP